MKKNSSKRMPTTGVFKSQLHQILTPEELYYRKLAFESYLWRRKFPVLCPRAELDRLKTNN